MIISGNAENDKIIEFFFKKYKNVGFMKQKYCHAEGLIYVLYYY